MLRNRRTGAVVGFRLESSEEVAVEVTVHGLDDGLVDGIEDESGDLVSPGTVRPASGSASLWGR